MNLPESWNPAIVYRLAAFFATFLGLDFLATVSQNPHVPTTTRLKAAYRSVLGMRRSLSRRVKMGLKNGGETYGN
jgi:hypothetical protein